MNDRNPSIRFWARTIIFFGLLAGFSMCAVTMYFIYQFLASVCSGCPHAL